MKQWFINLYRRLDRLQHQRSFLIAASAVLAVVSVWVFGSLLMTSYSLDAQRETLLNALYGTSHREGDHHAVTLYQQGQVTIEGVTYQLDRLQGEQDRFFDRNGQLTSAVFIVVEDMLSEQIPGWAPTWLLDQPQTTWMLAVVFIAWFQLIVWMRISLPFVLTAACTLLPAALFWYLGWDQTALAVAGIGLLVFTYVLLSRVTLALLSGETLGLTIMGGLVGMGVGVAAGVFVVHSANWLLNVSGGGELPPDAVQILYIAFIVLGIGATIACFLGFESAKQVFSVAHTVIKEASRSRISLVFIVVLLIALPLIPMWLDPEAPLRYRIQTFISRSLTLTFVLAACMTVFLSCASVAFEIRDRQIWHLMTKPLSRLNYLLGKWLGVVSVNLILLIVAGVSIFTFVQYLRTTPVAPGVQGQLDQMQVENEILTARESVLPEYHYLTEEQLQELRRQQLERTPEYAPSLDDIQSEHLARQRSIPAGRGVDFEFSGLEQAKAIGAPLTLRYRFYILDSDQHSTFPAGIIINDDERTAIEVTYVPTMVHVTTIPADYIREDGTILITIFNLHEHYPGQPGTGHLGFDQHDLELLYKVANFEGNFLRAMIVTWTKLAFLGILGIACSTFLSFAVACLLSFTIFLGGSIAPFLADALHYYGPLPGERIDWSDIGAVIRWAFTSFIAAISQGLVFMLGAFGEVKPTHDLVEGKIIPWNEVGLGVFRLGVVWSIPALLVGYIVMRSRQLAIYSGNG